MPFSCPEPEVTVDASVHTETAPIEPALQPLGRVLEVHWWEWTENGRCDFNVGDLFLVREGAVRVAPADVARLTELTTALDVDIPDDVAPHPRLSSWLPAEPEWRGGTGLDWSDGEEGSSVSVSYLLDSASGVVLFRSDANYDPASTPTASPS
ncbi:hypothetical protein GCM10011576_48270 [Micromonospora parathelypteridis]|nr:hypothetical protein GCM10011576_48270 [Micromonospora parathelypteridis]